jgi:hypothetical protein
LSIGSGELSRAGIRLDRPVSESARLARAAVATGGELDTSIGQSIVRRRRLVARANGAGATADASVASPSQSDRLAGSLARVASESPNYHEFDFSLAHRFGRSGEHTLQLGQFAVLGDESIRRHG